MHKHILAWTSWFIVATFSLSGQRAPDTEWPYYGGDSRSQKYSAVGRIDATNVQRLKVSWRWMSPAPENNWEVTPIMIGGVLYFTTGNRRQAVALDATNGKTLWTYQLDEGIRGERAVRKNNRGLAYWSDGQGDDRILVISPGYQLFALSAKTGRLIPTFGKAGLVDLFEGLGRPVVAGQIGSTSPVMVVKDIAVVGAALQNGIAPSSRNNVPGYIRGYDARTGRLVWTFHTIPQAGEFGNDSWAENSWRYTGNVGVWAPMSADQELGYVYLPVETPTGDFYGGHRPGANLFAESLVCLDARSGKRVWHYQLIHHGLWDWDTPAAPVLLDITVSGRPVKAVAQATKQCFIYVFDRVSGAPVWPIEERPVPQSDVPGERTSLTQPFPTKPPAFDRQGFSPEDLIDFTPKLKAEAVKIASQYKMGPLFTPPSLFSGDRKGTLMLPGIWGGANWEGAAADPETGVLYVPSMTSPYAFALEQDAGRSDMRYIGRYVSVEEPMGLPLVKPPWGRITAVDLNKGEHAWVKANGVPSSEIANNPLLKDTDLKKLGHGKRAFLLVTKTLLFAGEGSDSRTFRALSKQTGDVVFEMTLPLNETGAPMTYALAGKQYIAMAVSDGGRGEIVALSLE